MSPLALAYKAHITPATVYRIERGDAKPNEWTLRAIVEVLESTRSSSASDNDEAA